MFNASYINRARPNHTYNVQSDFIISQVLHGNLGGWASVGADYIVTQQQVNGMLNGNAHLAQGFVVQHTSKNALTGTGNIVALLLVKHILSGELDGNAKIAADISTDVSTGIFGALVGDANIGANISLDAILEGALNGDAKIGADIYLDTTVSGSLVGYASAYNIEESICYFSGVLMPGETLVIDSERPIVLLNGEKAFGLQSGDPTSQGWFNIDRQTVSIALDCVGSTGHEMEVFYNALYL